MGTKRVIDQQPTFAGGLNAVSDPSFLSPSQARQMQNMRLTVYGGASKRGGTQEVSVARPNSTNPCVGGLWWPSQQYFLVFSGGNLYLSNGSAVPMTWTVVAASVGNTFPWGPSGVRVFTGVGAVETVYIAGGTNLQSYDTTATWHNAIASTPLVNGLEVYNQRLYGWYFGNAVGNNSLYYSQSAGAIGSIGGDSLGVTASGGGTIQVTTFGQSGIINCRVIGASLLIFHIKGISRLTGFGQSDISVLPQAVSADFSLVGPEAITVHAGIGYGVSLQGLFRINEGAIAPVNSPQTPDPLPAALAAASSANTQATSVTYDTQTNEVWVCINGVGNYAYNTVLQAWSGPWVGPFANQSTAAFFTFPGEPLNNKAPYLLFCDNAGWILKCDYSASYTDYVTSGGVAGTPFTSVLQLHRMYGDDRSYSKSWRWANVLATMTSGATLPTCVQSSMLGGAGTTTFGTLASVPQVYYQPGSGSYGPFLDVTITDTGAAQSIYESAQVEGYLLGQR